MAGIIKANAVQLGDSATATQNFTLQTNVDGTAKLSRGNAGATTQDILEVDASGNLTAGAKKIFSQGNILGTVSQTAGVPTGAVIERGSNANGEYVRFADGTMICRLAYTASRTVNVSSLGAFAATVSEGAKTFPSAFSGGMPSISIEANSTGGPTFVGHLSALSVFGDTTYIAWPDILIYGTVSRSAQYYNVCYIAIGRWF